MQCVCIVRDIYWKAKLVHADLSEFNILYNMVRDEMVIIDVSQSVEHDHPCALMFLRKDCTNVNAFFRKHNVCVMTVKELFEFVTDPLIKDDDVDEYLARAQKIASARTEEELTQKDVIDEEVFKNAFIPQRLDEVINFERDHEKAKKGETENIYYANFTGMNKDLSGVNIDKHVHFKDGGDGGNKEEDKEHYDEENSDVTDDDNDDVRSDHDEGDEKLTEQDRKDLRKEHKKAVKEENREKRKEKMPKHMKKRKEKMGRGNKKKH